MADKGGFSRIKIGNAGGIVVKSFSHTECDDRTGKPFRQFMIVIDIAVDDQKAVCGQKFREGMKGIANIRQIFKEIQMIFLYI